MTVSIEKQDRIWTIIHARPEARNAMDPESADALTAAFLEFDAADEADVAVFYGEGGAFCAGWDLKYTGQIADDMSEVRKIDFPRNPAPGNGSDIPRGPLGPSRLMLSKPVIGAIAGPAVAGGMELALWCDVRIMEESAYLGVYCRRWGVPLIDGGTVRLPRLIGLSRAMDIVLTGRKVTAQECFDIGLATRVVANGSVREEAEAYAREIARFPQICMRADRWSMYLQQGHELWAAMEKEWYNGMEALEREGREGAARFAAGKGRHGDFSDI